MEHDYTKRRHLQAVQMEHKEMNQRTSTVNIRCQTRSKQVEVPLCKTEMIDEWWWVFYSMRSLFWKEVDIDNSEFDSFRALTNTESRQELFSLRTVLAVSVFELWLKTL